MFDNVAEYCDSELRSNGGGAAQVELLKYLEERAYPGKGKSKKKKTATPFKIVAWVSEKSTVFTFIMKY